MELMTIEEATALKAKSEAAYKAGKITEQQYLDDLKDASAGLKGYAAQLRTSTEQLKKSLVNLGSELVAGKSGASVYNNAINSTANAVDSFASKFGLFGKILGTVATAGAKYITAVTDQSDALFKTYQDISRSGLAVGMQDTFDNLQSMGYTVKELGNMSTLLKQNTETLIALGGTAADGAKQFAQVSRDIQFSEVGTRLKRMGMSVDDINQGIADYLSIQQLSGSTQKMTDQQLAASAEEYIIQQDKLTKLSGLAAKQQKDVVAEQMRMQQFAITQYGLQQTIKEGGPDSIEAKKKFLFNNNMVSMLTGKYGKSVAAEFAAYTSGQLTTEEAQKFARTFPQVVEYIKAGGSNYGKAMDISANDAKNTLDNVGASAAINMGEKFTSPIGELVRGVGGLSTSVEASGNAVDADQAKQQTGADTSTKNMVDLTTSQLNQTQAFDQLINDGIGPVTAVMKNLTSVVTAVTNAGGSLLGRGKSLGTGPAPTAPGGGPPAAPATDISKIISFSGGTGDRSHFDRLSGSVYTAFVQMAQNYFDTTGKKLQVNSAYRSPEEQANTNSGNNPKAAPGKSLHQQGLAVDINSGQRTELASSGLLGQYGFSLPPFQDPPHIQMPSADEGGILSGPKSGYQAMLHGTEAVVPLADGRSIPMQGGGGGKSAEIIKLMAMKIDRLDQLARGMAQHEDTSKKIYQQQS